MKTKRNATMVLGLLVVALGLAACPPPPWIAPHHVLVEGDVPLPPLPPPPPFFLPPAPSVVYSEVVGCEYVAGVDYDVFYVDGYFYGHHQGHWFCTHRPGTAWVAVEPAYVPTILIPGPPRPGWRASAMGPGRRVTSFRGSYPFPPPPPKPPAPGKLRARGDDEKPIRGAKPSSKGKIVERKTDKPIAPTVSPDAPGKVLRRPKAGFKAGKSEVVVSPSAVTKVAPTPTPTPAPKSSSEPASETKLKPKPGRASGRK